MSPAWHDRRVPDGSEQVSSAARPALLGPGVTGAAVGVLLAVLALPSPAVLLVGVLALQLLLAAGLLSLLDAPARTGSLVLAGVAAAVADGLALRGDGRAGDLAAVVALALVVALLHELARGTGRTRVTASLCATLLAVVLAVGAACLVALAAREAGGGAAAAAALAAGAACLLAGRLADASGSTPVLVPGRGVPGLVTGLVAGAVVAAVVAARAAELTTGRAALLGLAAAGAVAVGDLLVARAAAELPAQDHVPHAARRAAALRPVAVLLPYAVLGPVALAVGRAVLS